MKVYKDGAIDIADTCIGDIHTIGTLCDNCGKGGNVFELPYLDRDINLCPDCLRRIADIVARFVKAEDDECDGERPL